MTTGHNGWASTRHDSHALSGDTFLVGDEGKLRLRTEYNGREWILLAQDQRAAPELRNISVRIDRTTAQVRVGTGNTQKEAAKNSLEAEPMTVNAAQEAVEGI